MTEGGGGRGKAGAKEKEKKKADGRNVLTSLMW